jgi:REP element-mobilizing transposase RayT
MPHDYLHRLNSSAYRGTSAVHWSMTIAGRRTGWLNPLHHCGVREFLLHTLARHSLACPAYCLMPDHGHFLWLGLDSSADQQRASSYFRRHWNQLLRSSGFELQSQAFDHVLRPGERERGAFCAVATYILENPVRAALENEWQAYRYSGAAILGRPELDPREDDFWERFWRHWNVTVAPGETGARDGAGEPGS